eukprot:gene34638-44781_t
MATRSEAVKEKYLAFAFLLGALINFIPLLCGYTLQDPTTNQYPDYLHELSDFTYSSSLVAGISSNFPILVMYLFDKCLTRMGYCGSSSSNNKVDTPTSTVYVPLRESIVFLLLSDLLLLFWLIPYEHYEFIMLLLDARDTMYTFSMLSCLTKFSNPVWTSNSVILIETLLCSAFVLFVSVFLIGNWTVCYFPTNEGDPWSSVGVSYLTYYSYLMTACTICSTAMASCCAKLDASESKKILEVQQLFLRFFSHEIRTPLNSVYVGVTIILNELKQPDLVQGEQRSGLLLETAMDTQKSCKATLGILNGMILYDSIISGFMALEKTLFDPWAHVCDVVYPFKVMANEGSIDLQVVNNMPHTTPLLHLHADPGKIAQVIFNLVSNALKFTNRNGSVCVTLSVEDEGYPGDLEMGFSPDDQTRWLLPKCSTLSHPISILRSPKTYAESFMARKCLVIKVTDSGVGISAMKQLHLFDGLVRFTPGVLQQHGQGAGLGLFITKQIVEMHGGNLSVFSMGLAGEGSVFTVRLPCLLPANDSSSNNNNGSEALAALGGVDIDIRSPPSFMDFSIVDLPSLADPAADFPERSWQYNANMDASHANSNAVAPLVDTSATIKVLKFLVVDDSTMSRKMVCKALHTAGHHCEQASDGSISVKMVQQTMTVRITEEDMQKMAGRTPWSRLGQMAS